MERYANWEGQSEYLFNIGVNVCIVASLGDRGHISI